MEKKWTIPSKSKIQYTYLQVTYNEKDLVKEIVCGTRKESNGIHLNL